MMQSIPYVFIPLFVWCCAQVTKVVIDYYLGSPLRWSSLWVSGGFPSTHGTLTSSMLTVVFLIDGWHTTLFMTVSVISFLIRYDAANVRYESGKHAQRINLIKKEIDQVLQVEKIQSRVHIPWFLLKERIGHTPIEVLGGIVYWTFATLCLFWICNYFGIIVL